MITVTFFIAGEDYMSYSYELVFSPSSGGGARVHFSFRTISDSTTEGSETFLLEASAGDWPFTQNTTIVTINECFSKLVNSFNHVKKISFNYLITLQLLDCLNTPLPPHLSTLKVYEF